MPWSKIVGVTTDTAGNELKFGKLVLEKAPHAYHQQCLPHRINLCITDVMGSFKKEGIIEERTGRTSLLKRMQSVVKFFHQSNLAADALKKWQESKDMKPHKLRGFCKTRFTSALEMMETLMKNHHGIIANLIPCPLSTEDWECMPHMIKSLRPFCHASTALGGESYPTLHNVVIMSLAIISTPAPHCENEHDPPVPQRALTFHAHIMTSAKQRLGSPDVHELVAAALDPRQNKIGYLGPGERGIVINAVDKLVDALGQQPLNQPCFDVQEIHAAADSETKDNGGSWISMLVQHHAMVDPVVTYGTPFFMYTLEPSLLAPHGDPMEYWASIREGHNYYNLARIAHRIWTIPASSLPCERIFSSAGNVVTEKRTRLSPGRVEQLVFLHNNYDITSLSHHRSHA